MAGQPQPVFPLEQYPPAPGTASLLGIYEQRQEGLHMQRGKVHRGQITPAQLTALGELASALSPGYPLHVTTRQDVQFHGVRSDDLPELQRGLAEAGLTSVGACGDSLRNVTTCPGNGLVEGTLDVSGVADAIRRSAESLPFIRDLPRKFKVSVSGCREGCARPWINCLGFVARSDGSFQVIGAGSLGHRPAAGIELYEAAQPAEVVPLVIASLRLFNAEGDREHRTRARFRHVRERMGDEEFRRRLDARFRRELREGSWPTPELPKVEEGLPLQAHLHLPLGDLRPEEARRLGEDVADADGVIRLGLEHDMLIYAPRSVRLGAELEAMDGGPSIVACPGTEWCKRGLCSSRGLETQLRSGREPLDGLTVAISGCPNNCAHAAVADIGLTGRIRKVSGERAECFRLVAGGGKGASHRLGVELHPAVAAETTPQVVAWLAQEYRGGGRTCEFAAFVTENRNRLAADIRKMIGR